MIDMMSFSALENNIWEESQLGFSDHYSKVISSINKRRSNHHSNCPHYVYVSELIQIMSETLKEG